MFDPDTSRLMRSAQPLDGLDPSDLPRRLAAEYVSLAARRLRIGVGGMEEAQDYSSGAWPLPRLADAYEVLASLGGSADERAAAAFVAATAQQLIALSGSAFSRDHTEPHISRATVSPEVAATLLFLIAEQYSDALDSSRLIRESDDDAQTLPGCLALCVRDLAQGRPGQALERNVAAIRSSESSSTLADQSSDVLLRALCGGVQRLASIALGRDDGRVQRSSLDDARTVFDQVLEASTPRREGNAVLPRLSVSHPGIRHAASLLRAVAEVTQRASVCALPLPTGGDAEFWRRWLAHRAKSAPFLWPDHRRAVESGFHLPGSSATVVLPTGAGKSTVAYIKIAAALSMGRKVVFLAPTHALVDQVTRDLQHAFPASLLGAAVSNDFDRLFAAGTAFRAVEVMTPERCLAMLSSAPEAFAEVSLLVFDECHLLSPTSGQRRSLDAMLCVLAFGRAVPDADYLFLSAMLRNGGEFAEWVGELTGRRSIHVEALWKPSRQARGVVVYRQGDLARALSEALRVQTALDSSQGRRAENLRAAARRQLGVEPLVLFGLEHNWAGSDSTQISHISLQSVSGSDVQIDASYSLSGIAARPNANEVAAHLAVAAVRSGVKVIVFVNSRRDAVSTAERIRRRLPDPTPFALDDEMWGALEDEFGSIGHSLLVPNGVAQPHTAHMLPLEREMAERMFMASTGAMVLVATPTLAQGLNLPASMVVLAGDRRAEGNQRRLLETHEVLNAAGRAGRAGHVSNGVVILIPEPVTAVPSDGGVGPDALARLERVFPHDDRCLDILDPLQVVLDRISAGEMYDSDVVYVLDRLAASVLGDEPKGVLKAEHLSRSFAAFTARRRGEEDHFDEQLRTLSDVVAARPGDRSDVGLVTLSAQTGVPLPVIEELRDRIGGVEATLPQTIIEWLEWIFDWLDSDAAARDALLARDEASLAAASGANRTAGLGAVDLRRVHRGVLAWVHGSPLRLLEAELGGNPVEQSKCPRARALVTGFTQNGLPYVTSIVARTASQAMDLQRSRGPSRAILECLSLSTRRGFDLPTKTAFAELRHDRLTRVQVHDAYRREVGDIPPVLPGEGYAEVLARVRALVGR